MILDGETCEVLKTSQVFGEPTHHIHCGCVVDCVLIGSVTEWHYENGIEISTQLVEMEKHAPLATGEVYGENINRSELNKLSEEMEIKLTEKLPVVEGKILSAKGRRLTLDIGKENQIREDMKIIIS